MHSNGTPPRWDERWRRQRPVVLTEEAGLDRSGEIVELRMDFASGDVEAIKRELRVVHVRGQGDLVEVPSQLYNTSTYYNGSAGTVVFEASVAAGESATYLVCHDAPGVEAPDYRSSLKVTPPASGLAYGIETSAFSIVLDERSGQIRSIREAANGVVLEGKNKVKPVDYAPDVVPNIEGRGYNGVRHWNPPSRVTTDAGPLVFAMQRSSLLDQPANNDEPGITNVEVSVNYRFFADQPYYRQGTFINVVEDIELHSLRNGAELGFVGNIYTHAAWVEDGEIMAVELDSFDPAVLEDVDNGFRGDWIPADTPWFTFFNAETGAGIAALYLRYDNIGLYSYDGIAPTHNEAIYVVGGPSTDDPGDYYFRAPLWEHAIQDQERAPATYVPRGSIYYESNAVLPFTYTAETRLAPVVEWSTRLRNPLRAHYRDVDERDLRDQPAPPRKQRRLEEVLP
jgi:hypothetical protein